MRLIRAVGTRTATIRPTTNQPQKLKTKAKTQCIGPRDVCAGYGAGIGDADSCAWCSAPGPSNFFFYFYFYFYFYSYFYLYFYFYS